MLQSSVRASIPAPTIADARDLTAGLIEIGRLMIELSEIIETETGLVRAGRVAAATKLAERKGEVARAFMRAAAELRAGSPRGGAGPQLVDALRRQYEELCARLRMNLTVLATARAVSEGILRGVSNELAKRSTVQTYGASGRRHTETRRGATPLAVSRSL